jgi:hypothetical protein
VSYLDHHRTQLKLNHLVEFNYTENNYLVPNKCNWFIAEDTINYQWKQSLIVVKFLSYSAGMHGDGENLKTIWTKDGF